MDTNKKKLAYSGVGVLAIAVVAVALVLGGGMFGTQDDYLGPMAEIIAEEQGVSMAEATNLAGMAAYQVVYITCSEDDGGKNFDKRGTVTVTYSSGTRPKTYTDFCSGSKLVEYYCNGKNVYGANPTCDYGCVNGACNPKPPIVPPVPVGCNDTDNGDYPDKFGTITYYKDGQLKTTIDQCSGTNSVLECYCYKNMGYCGFRGCTSGKTCQYGECKIPACTNDCSTTGVKSCNGTSVLTCGNFDSDPCLELGNSTNCVFGCENGACRAPTNRTGCNDTDTVNGNSNNPALRGTITYFNNDGQIRSETDECVNSTFLKECVCSNNVGYCWPINCSSAYVCQNGACIPAPIPPVSTITCNDSDGGYNVYTMGTARIYNGTRVINVSTDRCSGSSLQEFYCSGSSIVSNMTGCPGSYMCINGACSLYGNISVVSTPSGVWVYISGVNSGQTPVTVSKPPGQYGVEMSLSGYMTYKQNVTVVAGQIANVSAVLSVPPPCNDTDGGQNATVYGVVTYYSGSIITIPDMCNSTSASFVTEAYCYSSTYGTYININCPANTTCSNGRCA
jgi:hypothetical protein